MIFSILAFLAVIISICITDRRKSLYVQSLNCLFEAIYGFLISAFTGAVLSIINFVRSCIFINQSKFTKKIYLLILIIFESLIIVNCIITWRGIISILPTIGSLIRTYCLWQTNMKYVRISGITSGLTYSLYYIYYEGWFMAFGYFLLLTTGLFAVYSMDFKEIVNKLDLKKLNKKIV